jgi:hypothetical protein
MALAARTDAKSAAEVRRLRFRSLLTFSLPPENRALQRRALG